MMRNRFLADLLGVMLAVGLSTATSAYAQAGHIEPARAGNGPTPLPPTPPPMQPPFPAPPPLPRPTDYVIYFGFDQADISPDAQDILVKAAKDVAAIETLNTDYRTRVTAYIAQMTPPGLSPRLLQFRENEVYPPNEVVTAYADTAGSRAYDLRLAMRRAKAAAAALVALGVPPASIQTSWMGKTDPAVDTGNNVQEPLNRRVTIHVAANP